MQGGHAEEKIGGRVTSVLSLLVIQLVPGLCLQQLHCLTPSQTTAEQHSSGWSGSQAQLESTIEQDKTLYTGVTGQEVKLNWNQLV